MITSPALIDALCYQQLSIISSLASSAAQHYKLKKLRWLETSGRWSFISNNVIDRKITWWDVFGQVISTYQWSIITSPALVDALNCQQLSIISNSASSTAQHHRQLSIISCSTQEAALVRNFGKMVFYSK